MSLNHRIHDVAKDVAKNTADTTADTSTSSGGTGWVSGALKVGLLLLTVAVSAGTGGSVDAADALSEFGKK